MNGYFDHLSRFVNGIPEVREWGIQLEHYIVSGGIKDILDGCDIITYFKKVYACEYEYKNGEKVSGGIVKE